MQITVLILCCGDQIQSSAVAAGKAGVEGASGGGSYSEGRDRVREGSEGRE